MHADKATVTCHVEQMNKELRRTSPNFHYDFIMRHTNNDLRVLLFCKIARVTNFVHR
jgi:hypothetical protein